MYLILIADIHLASSTADSFGVNTHANFEQVLAKVRHYNPDHVVLMGDYSLKAPLRQDVDAACARVEKTGIPASFISGNHDRSFDIAEVSASRAHLHAGELFYRKDLGETMCLFLDTSKGFVSVGQRTWLAAEMAKAQGPIHVFMHHPPIKMGVPFMDDNYALQDEGGELYEILFGGRTPVHVYCGHYHTVRSTQVGIHSVHLCPSTYFQLDPSQAEFGVSHAMPGIRHVQILDGQVRTWIEFLRKLN